MIAHNKFAAAVFPNVQFDGSIGAVGFGEHGVSVVRACAIRIGFDPHGIGVVACDVEQVVVRNGGRFRFTCPHKAKCLSSYHAVPKVCPRGCVNRVICVLKNTMVGLIGVVKHRGSVGLVHSIIAD